MKKALASDTASNPSTASTVLATYFSCNNFRKIVLFVVNGLRGRMFSN
jgi:hypothetical protein